MRTQLPSLSRCVLFVFSILLLLAWPIAASAQTTGRAAVTQDPAAPSSITQARITQAIDEQNLVVLHGNRHPLARPEFDRGPAPLDLRMDRMLLVLKRSPEQEAALQKLLQDQQDKSSPHYRRWVTPEEFGQQFGPADSDIRQVTNWLQGHGFQNVRVSRGRAVIEFSGTASQLQEGFHTEIHHYAMNGQEHWANSQDPQIPTALTPLVAGVATLHSFRRKPRIRIADERIPAKLVPGSAPQLTSQSGQHALGPGDYNVIYNINPVLQPPPGATSSSPGFGTTIAVVGRSNINVQDVARFRNIFNLANNNPRVFVDGPDPGDLGGAEEAEAVLDTTWSGALAPYANVELIISASTNTTDGVDLSELYIIDNALGAIMTESFSTCESSVTSAEALNISQLAEQAAAEGITYIVSTGDTGSAGCDNLSETQATGPFSVNALASTPFTVAVGGTQFNENGNNALYWNSSNNQFTLASARSYIPEDVWNESCTVALCGQQKANIAAGGGGASVFFSKPSWQSGVAGIPNDGTRDLPDVALTAASHDPYLLCLGGSCQPDSQGNFFFAAASGTSAAAPSFAGIVALVNWAVVPLNSHPRLGQINYVLYRLAANQSVSSCNGSSTSNLPAASCVFNDVTVGNNAVPGEVGYGTGTAKYQSGPGYDLASGLGSMNVANLVNNWTNVTLSPTTTTLSLSPTALTHGTSVNANITVTSSSGTPTGDVSLFRSGTSPGTPSLPVQGNFFTLNSSGSASISTNLLPGGYYSVSAHYAGDGKFMASDSTAVGTNVTPEPSSTVATALTAGQNGNFISLTSAPYGSFVYLRADVTGQSGIGHPTGSVNFADNGSNIAGDPYTLNSQGNIATPLGFFTFAPGQHSIIANYSGDPSFNASVSPSLNFTTTQASTAIGVTLGSTALVTLTATVSTNSGGSPPSGTVTFFIGGTQVGSPVTLSGIPAVTNPQAGVLQAAQATASLTDSQLANGQYTLSATYSGDSNYSSSSSPPTIINVHADYSLMTSLNAMTITNPGGTGSLTLTINPLEGFNGTVNFSCSGLPAMSVCQFNPTSVIGSGSAAMTITTTAPTALLMPVGPSRGIDQRLAAGGVTLAGVFLLAGLFWPRRWGKLLNFAAFVFVLYGLGCGGGGSNPPPPPPARNPGTLPGTYAVTVTATSGALTHSSSLTLTVQ